MTSLVGFRRALRIPDIVSGFLRRAGESARHETEFARPSETWSYRDAMNWGDLLLRGGYPAFSARSPEGLRAQMNAGMLSPWGPSGPVVPNLGPGSQLMSVLPPSTVFMPDFTAFQTELKGFNEVVRQALYSFVSYPTAGSLDLLFFADSQTVGRQNTNMEAAGQLPGNQMQLVVGIRFKDIAPFADVSVTNTAPALAAGETYRLLTNNCWIEGYISNKLYQLVAPVDFLPPGNGIGTLHSASAIAATTDNFSHAQSGIASNEAIFRQDPPLGILPTRPFQWHYRASVLNTVTTAHRVGIYLDGFQLRAVL